MIFLSSAPPVSTEADTKQSRWHADDLTLVLGTQGVIAVSKTLIDLDDELLAQAVEFLGTKTKKDTVNGALNEYVKFMLRMSFGERLASGKMPELADPDLMAQVWR